MPASQPASEGARAGCHASIAWLVEEPAEEPRVPVRSYGAPGASGSVGAWPGSPNLSLGVTPVWHHAHITHSLTLLPTLTYRSCLHSLSLA